MQLRFTDRGRPYDHEAWRNLYGYTLSTGVYSGFNMSPGTSGSQVVLSPGALKLPIGVVVVETADVTVEIGGTFPPSTANVYTVLTAFDEVAMGLIGGTSMTYAVSSTELTEQPSNGVIVGWIRHPGGSAPLDQSMLVDAPRYAPVDIAADYVASAPLVQYAPDLVYVADAAISATLGYDSTNKKPWRGWTNTTDPTPVVTQYMPFRVNKWPDHVKLDTILPIGCSMDVVVYDTTGTSVATASLAANTSWTEDTIDIPRDSGTWTIGGEGLITMATTVALGSVPKTSRVEVGFWPYSVPMFS